MLSNKTHRPKKSLGQNFLKSEIALRKIIEAGEIKPDDVILEIGPGKGALTEKLLGHPISKLIAVEKDRELFEFLKEKFKKEIAEKKLILINNDILKIDPLLISPFAGGEKTSYKIIANIPYNITGAILKKFLTAKRQPELMVLLVQKEVAESIVARDKKESLLSISVKAYGEPKMIMKVEKRYFSPAPKVDSAIISITSISRKLFTNSPLEEYPEVLPQGEVEMHPPRLSATPQEGNLEQRFWQIVKAGFAHKRKKLSSNLKTLQKNGRLASVESLENKRAEDLTLEDWIKLAKE